MKFKKIGFLMSTLFVLIATTILLSSCTCKIREDQLAKLAELRRQEKSIGSEISEQQSAKAKIDNELRQVTSEANDCNSRRDIVKQRLSVWPNIWSDYTPIEP